jgi:hypothetical protein
LAVCSSVAYFSQLLIAS